MKRTDNIFFISWTKAGLDTGALEIGRTMLGFAYAIDPVYEESKEKQFVPVIYECSKKLTCSSLYLDKKLSKPMNTIEEAKAVCEIHLQQALRPRFEFVEEYNEWVEREEQRRLPWIIRKYDNESVSEFKVEVSGVSQKLVFTIVETAPRQRYQPSAFFVFCNVLLPDCTVSNADRFQIDKNTEIGSIEEAIFIAERYLKNQLKVTYNTTSLPLLKNTNKNLTIVWTLSTDSKTIAGSDYVTNSVKFGIYSNGNKFTLLSNYSVDGFKSENENEYFTVAQDTTLDECYRLAVVHLLMVRKNKKH